MQVQFSHQLASKLSSWTRLVTERMVQLRLSGSEAPGEDCSCCGGHDAPPQPAQQAEEGEANSWVDMIHGEMALHFIRAVFVIHDESHVG